MTWMRLGFIGKISVVTRTGMADGVAEWRRRVVGVCRFGYCSKNVSVEEGGECEESRVVCGRVVVCCCGGGWFWLLRKSGERLSFCIPLSPIFVCSVDAMVHVSPGE